MCERVLRSESNLKSRMKYLFAAAGFVVCCWAAWYAASAGASRLLSETATRLRATEYAGEAGRLSAKAEALSPSDPEAHYARAVAAAQRGEDIEAVAALERLAALRPRYYQTWLKLARARERAGDAEGALRALRESLRLAPFYAEPRWQLGNTLLRAGRREEAFAELRLAAASRPSLAPYTFDLAWRAYDEDARAVAQAAAPTNDAARVALARFFVKRGRASAALEQLRAASGGVGVEERRSLVGEMVAAGQFAEAYEVWAAGGRRVREEGSAESSFFDGGFEERSPINEPGFGWQFVNAAPQVSVSLDVTEPHAGARSLRFEFDGATDANARLASQLVRVEPDTRYRLRFAARTADLLSGAPPVVAVVEAAGEGRELARARELPQGSSAWQEYEVEFQTPGGARAVSVVVRRQSCAQPPCPVFGRVWFDDFSLQKLSAD